MASMLLSAMLATLAILVAWRTKRLWAPRAYEGDALCPANVLLLVQAVANLPFMWWMAGSPASMDWRILRLMDAAGADYVAFMLGIVNVLYTGGIVLGMALSARIGILSSLPPWRMMPLSKAAAILAALGAMSVAALVVISIWQEAGGLVSLADDYGSRHQYLAGRGYLLQLTVGAPVALALCAAFVVDEKRRLSGLSLLLLLCGVGFALQLSLGGRKPAIMLVFAAVWVWHYNVARIKCWGRLGIVCAGGIAPVFICWPLLRRRGMASAYMYDTDLLLRDLLGNAELLVKQVGYTDSYIATIAMFDVSSLWWGRSFFDLLLAPVPRSWLPSKPPLDEGVYLSSMALGMQVEPGMASSDLYPSGWPMETIGCMFANWHFPGVFAGALIVGFVVSACYVWMHRSGKSWMTVLMYLFACTTFHVSNLRIMGLVSNCLAIAVFATAIRVVSLLRPRGSWE